MILIGTLCFVAGFLLGVIFARHWFLLYLEMHPQYRLDREKAERDKP
jgi:uncharacterized protein YneF (UPF0154 family)